MSSAICFNLDQSKILSSGKGLKQWLYLKTPLRQMAQDSQNFSTKLYNMNSQINTVKYYLIHQPGQRSILGTLKFTVLYDINPGKEDL